MSGTQIDPASVRRAGASYTSVGDDIGTAAARLHAPSAEAADFGRHYGDHGQAYRAAMDNLARSMDAWRDGSHAVGTGLTKSASAHSNTDTRSAAAVTEASRGQ